MTEVPLVTAIRFVRRPGALIRIAVGDLAVEPFQVVIVLDKRPCQIVEQRGITGRIGQSQVVWWINDSHVEVIGPDTIDDGFREELFLVVPQPVHQRLARVGELSQISLLSFTKQFGFTGAGTAALSNRSSILVLAGRSGLRSPDFFKRDNLAFRSQLAEFSTQLATAETRVDAQVFQHFFRLFAILRTATETRIREEVLELMEVLHRPLIERVLVTLSTLNPRAQEVVGKRNRSIFRRPEVVPCPVVRHGRAFGVRGCWLLALFWTGVNLRHLLAEFLEAFAFFSAVRQYETFGDLVVSDVLFDSHAQPLVPVPSRLAANGRHVIELVVAVARPVSEASRPPRRIGGAFEQCVDLLCPLVLVRIVNEVFDFLGTRQRAGHVE